MGARGATAESQEAGLPVAGVLAAGVAAYRRLAGPLLASAALVLVPVLVVAVFVFVAIVPADSALVNHSVDLPSGFAGSDLTRLALAAAAIFLGTWVLAASVMTAGWRDPSVRRAVGRLPAAAVVALRFLPVAAVAAAAVYAVAGSDRSVLLRLLAGAAIAVVTTLCARSLPAMVLERRGLWSSLRRSRALGRGRTFATLLALIVPLGALAAVAEASRALLTVIPWAQPFGVLLFTALGVLALTGAGPLLVTLFANHHTEAQRQHVREQILPTPLAAAELPAAAPAEPSAPRPRAWLIAATLGAPAVILAAAIALDPWGLSASSLAGASTIPRADPEGETTAQGDDQSASWSTDRGRSSLVVRGDDTYRRVENHRTPTGVGRPKAVGLSPNGPVLAYWERDRSGQNLTGRLLVVRCLDSSCGRASRQRVRLAGASPATREAPGALAIALRGHRLAVAFRSPASTPGVLTCEMGACGRTATVRRINTPADGSSVDIAVDDRNRPTVLTSTPVPRRGALLTLTRCRDTRCSRTDRQFVSGAVLTTPDEDGDARPVADVELGPDGQALIAYADFHSHALKALRCSDRPCSRHRTTTLANPSGAPSAVNLPAADTRNPRITFNELTVSHSDYGDDTYFSDEGRRRALRCRQAWCGA